MTQTIDGHGNIHAGDGRFSEHLLSEGDTEQVFAQRRPADVLDDPRVVAALGDTDLDDGQKQGLRMLLDPRNDPSGGGDLDSILHRFSRGVYVGPRTWPEIGARLQVGYERSEGQGAFDLELIDRGRGIEDFSISRELPGSPGFSMSIRSDISELDEGRGLRVAAETAGAMVWRHDQLKAEMERRFPRP